MGGSLGQNPTEAKLQDIINEVDANGNGTMDFPEFLTMIARKMKATVKKKFGRHFESLMRMALGTSVRRSSIIHDQLRRNTDEEGDEMYRWRGPVRYEEFVQMVTTECRPTFNSFPTPEESNCIS